MTSSTATGSIPSIVKNNDGVYEGDLKAYFRILWKHAQNLNNPYHNFRHICHVLFLCHQACVHYSDELTLRKRRILLIAAIFHDFDHTGVAGPDRVNIEAALLALKRHILPEDAEHYGEIERLIQATEYPYSIETKNLSLSGKIIRDADMGQAFSVAWIQQVIFGLAAEWGRTPLEVVAMQGPFHEKLRFSTAWGREMFPDSVVKAKIEEAKGLLELLADEPVMA